jgi:glycine/D-amino acid oxidase-like deaminating enzyme/nitrite reductase/ring-hydroxylating ferredoxin subunit
MTGSHNNAPYWVDSASMPRFPHLEDDLTADVLIVGGGITGLTAAYLLARAGRSVAVLERERLGSMDSGHTSAHLTAVTDLGLTALEQRFGRDHAQATWDAGFAAIAEIDAIVREEKIACEFSWVPGYLYSASEGGDTRDVAGLREDAALAIALGFDASFVEDIPGVQRPGIRFDHQAKFHVRKYLAGLTRAIVALGGRCFEHTTVEEFTERPLGAKANGRTITADYIIVATHTPLWGNTPHGRAKWLETNLALYSSYVIAGRAAKGAMPEALFWSTAHPYGYLRVDQHRDYDLVIYGGEDHKTGQETDTGACYQRLEQALTLLVPSIELTHRWSGQVIETSDGLPFLGETADRQFVATGFSGNGMTFGTLGAMMACDRVMGRLNPWRDLFAPDRPFLKRGLWDYLRENKDYPYYRIRDQFAGAATRSLRSVRRGHGAVVDLHGQKVAAFRDETGKTTLRSAVCTHAGCLVGWNDAERTWDCPCHGSRFKPNGDVLAGPAQSALGIPSQPDPDPVREAPAPEASLRLLVLALSVGAMVLLPPLALLLQMFKGQESR